MTTQNIWYAQRFFLILVQDWSEIGPRSVTVCIESFYMCMHFSVENVYLMIKCKRTFNEDQFAIQIEDIYNIRVPNQLRTEEQEKTIFCKDSSRLIKS